MMKIRGFIEGFYNRKPKKNDYGFENSNITHYIYAPKEDSYIRQKWRLKDKSLEARSIPKNIAQVYTLSPGADFNRKSKKDFNFLLSKFNFAIDKGFSEVGLLFDDIDINKAVSCPLEPGEVSFHHGLTLHASQPNSSNDRRIGLNFQFISTDMKQLKSKNDSAICVRGEDKYKNFKTDQVAKDDFDHEAYQHLLVLNNHYNETIRKN